MREDTPLLLLNHAFDFELVAGITQSEKGNYLDFVVDRPNGMNGYMLQLTTFGKGYVFDGKNGFNAEQGQLLLFAPNAVQNYYRHPESQYWHYKWIYFYPQPRWIKWLNWATTQQKIGRISIKERRYFQEISQLFTKIEQELKFDSPLKADMASSLLEYLLMKCATSEQIHIDLSLDSRILKICDLLTQDLSKNFSIENLAEQVFLSPSRLSHLFKQSLGVSIVHWRELQCITEAKKLLYFSDIPISTLAKSLGYDDPFYFSKVFKKHLGYSPSQFRSMERKKDEL